MNKPPCLTNDFGPSRPKLGCPARRGYESGHVGRRRQISTGSERAAGARQRAFTLVELLVVFLVLALLVSMAGPAFLSLIRSKAIETSVNAFMTDVRFARSEALRRSGGVVMCRSANPNAPDATCSPSQDIVAGWASGWIVFVDGDGNGTRSQVETILRAQAQPRGVDAISTEGGTGPLRFSGMGRLVSPDAPGTFRFGGEIFSPEQRRVVCLSISGRARNAGNGAVSCAEQG
jgi:type IV fimbrial biogenesis protein FimT